MGTVVCQGFQSSLESQLNEPRTLRVRLSSPNHLFFQPLGLASKSCSLHSTGEDTSKLISNNFSCDKEKRYVQHSPSKTLNEKSLALCTENLGNETGSEITDDDVFSFTSFDVETRYCRATETKTFSSTQGLKRRKRNMIHSFPPPLTSMMGSECIQLRPHRQDGKLVLNATKEPPRNTCFRAERSNGRLRLSILRGYVRKEEETESEVLFAEYDERLRQEESQVKSMENHIQLPERCVEGDKPNRGLLNWDHFRFATS